VHYKKYQIQSPLFSLRDPRLSEKILAAFSGVRKPLAPPPPARPRSTEGS
jgi:hypothetical protein